MDVKITPRRPIACEKALDSTIEIAKKAVVNDRAKELLAANVETLAKCRQQRLYTVN